MKSLGTLGNACLYARRARNTKNKPWNTRKKLQGFSICFLCWKNRGWSRTSPTKKPHVPSIWRSRRLWHDLSPRDVPWRHNTIRCRRQSGGTRIVSDTIPRLPPSIEATSTRFVYQVFLQKPSLLLLLWYGHFHHSCKKIALEKKLFLNCCEKVALRGIPFSLQVMRRERFVPWTHCGR